MWPFRRRKREPIGNPEQGRFMRVLTVLSPEDQIAIGGIPSEAVAGLIGAPVNDPDDMARREGFSLDEFRLNPAFSAFMQHVIRTFGPDDPELREAARQQGDGSVGVIDLRTPEGPMWRVPVEDIVGIFAVEGGKLGLYHANDKHLVFSVNGLVQLPLSLREAHIRELKRLRVSQEHG